MPLQFSSTPKTVYTQPAEAGDIATLCIYFYEGPSASSKKIQSGTLRLTETMPHAHNIFHKTTAIL